ncbi:HAD family hydrolase [Geobacter sp. SVR]|uniref:HAD family hydrolase n=1 Tax=Geobacter sp. SVR TaxID=2495594 RepID=UPI00143EFFCF|nr:HAD-IIIA family hydrolase [Geobacter sp. SVR]BCS53340.1 haloacid dehalogenase [Geobacter sp. SVR]GCF85534.1 haloacid dehalogenase [Geobacter sp. SVR]
MTARAVLFDLDGTLIDSLDDLTDAVNHVLNSFGKAPLAKSAVRKLVGKGSRNLVQRALATDDFEDIERGHALFETFNAAHIADKSRLYPGARQALEELTGRGVLLAVVSNKNEALSRLILKVLSIDHFFVAICGGDTYPERKPSPLPLLRTSGALSTLPENTVMVGDSINDIEAGKLAGMATIGCTWGYGGLDELEQADHLAGSCREVSDILMECLFPA